MITNPGSRPVMPLTVVRTAFGHLVTGATPLAIDGRLFPGMPDRPLPLDEVRDRLLHRRCPQTLRDAVWAHLVLLARTRDATWTMGCAGIALPALTTIATTLSSRFANDPTDIHAAVLAGFIAELTRIDVRKPRIMLRLRWAAYRTGHASLREALDAPTPTGSVFAPAAAPPSWGHPDFVLARAVAEHIITAHEAELVGATRLEGIPLAVAAGGQGISYEAAKKTRHRAERRLVAYLTTAESAESPANPDDGGPALRVMDTVTITSAGTTSCSTTSPISPIGQRKPGATRPRTGRKQEFTNAGEHQSPRTRPSTRARARRRDAPRHG